MTFEEAQDLIGQHGFHTRTSAVVHARRCLERLGNPDRRIGQVIHIAGTNGKGSTSAFLSSVLRKASMKTGTFTSPHLIRMSERIAVNGEMISDEDFVRIFEKVYNVTKSVEADGGGDAGYFEFLFLMAMVYFAEAGTEAAVIEVGLGGTLDATNVLENPAVSVITSIGLDHMEYLGSTIPEIAGEKAGILKAGTPCVYDASDPAAASVIRARAEELGIAAFPLRKEDFRIRKAEGGEIDFSTSFRYDRHADFRIRSLAPYQAGNAALSVLALKVLKESNPVFDRVSAEHVRAGLLEMYWPARMEEIRPRVFLDGAHNGAGISRFLEAAGRIAGGSGAALVFGVMGSKDYTKMIRLLAREMAWTRVFVTKIPDTRGADTAKIAQLFREEGIKEVKEVPDLREAVPGALRSLTGGEYLFICGSLYLAGAVKKMIREIRDDQF